MESDPRGTAEVVGNAPADEPLDDSRRAVDPAVEASASAAREPLPERRLREDDAPAAPRQNPRPLVIKRVTPSSTSEAGSGGELAEFPSATSEPAAHPPVDPYRPLTLRETLDMVQDQLRRMDGTWRGLGITILATAVICALTWVLISLAVPWSGGIVESVQAALTLDVAWPPIPAPDDPSVSRATSLVAAAWVGAPLILGVFWFTAGYHLDRTSRRAFRVVDRGLVRQTAGYTVMAIAVIFPLIILGLVGSAWGAFALLTWAAAGEAWSAAGTLVALLAIFAGLVRAANAVLDRRYGG